MYAIRPEFRHISGYQSALEALNRSKPFPKTEEPNDFNIPRALEAPRKRHMSIRRMGSRLDILALYKSAGLDDNNSMDRMDHIALRLYSADLVVWREDNVVILTAHATRSSDIFANRCLPSSIWVQYNSGKNLVVSGDFSRNMRIYDMRYVSGAFRRNEDTGYWEPLSPIEQWVIPHCDRKQANAALKAAGYPDFCTWLRAYLAMAKPGHPKYRLVENMSVGQIYDMLVSPDRAGWMELANHHYRPGIEHHYDNLSEMVRNAVYQKHNLVTYTKVDYLTSYNQVKSNDKALKRYHWLRYV